MKVTAWVLRKHQRSSAFLHSSWMDVEFEVEPVFYGSACDGAEILAPRSSAAHKNFQATV